MNTYDAEYLAGYVSATRDVHTMLQKYGWARAKGLMKSFVLRNGRLYYTGGPWSKGYTDAMLDSVN